MINLIFDSSIFHQDRTFSSPNFKQIKVLSQRQLLGIHIPEFVRKECESKNEMEISQEVKTIYGTLDKLKKKGLASNEILKINSILKCIAEFENFIDDSVVNNWDNFISESNAKVYGFEEIEVGEIVNDYFKGFPPYKNRKNRNDFPDSFIFHTIKEIVENNENCVFICQDKELSRSVNHVYRIESFESLSKFTKSDLFKPLRNIYEKELEIASEKESISNLEKFIIDSTNEYLLIQLNHYQVEDEMLYSDDKLGTVQNLSKVLYNKLIIEDTVFVEDTAYITLLMKGIVTINYFINKQDYQMLGDNRSEKISVTNWNDYVLWAEEDFLMEFELEVGIKRKDLNASDFILNNVGIRKTKIVAE